MELATPTGVALLAHWARQTSALPLGRVVAVGTGAGGRELPGRPNVLRLVLVETADADDTEPWVLVAANVDDLDPRIWPV